MSWYLSPQFEYMILSSCKEFFVDRKCPNFSVLFFFLLWANKKMERSTSVFSKNQNLLSRCHHHRRRRRRHYHYHYHYYYYYCCCCYYYYFFIPWFFPSLRESLSFSDFSSQLLSVYFCTGKCNFAITTLRINMRIQMKDMNVPIDSKDIHYLFRYPLHLKPWHISLVKWVKFKCKKWWLFSKCWNIRGTFAMFEGFFQKKYECFTSSSWNQIHADLGHGSCLKKFDQKR